MTSGIVTSLVKRKMLFDELKEKFRIAKHSTARDVIVKQLKAASEDGKCFFLRLDKEDRDWLKEQGFTVNTHQYNCDDGRGMTWKEPGWIVRWDSI